MKKSRSLTFVRGTLNFVFLLVLLSCGGGDSTPSPSPANNTPVAFAGPDQNVIVNSLVTLDGSGSYDEDNDPLTYSWAFTQVPSGNTAILTNATAVRPIFVPNVGGNYVARLIVNDGKTEGANSSMKDESRKQEKTSHASYVTITASSTPAVPSPGDNQLWKMERIESSFSDSEDIKVEHYGGPYRIVAKHSNKVLDVVARSTVDGANVQQYTYNGGDHQIWYFNGYSSSSTGPYSIMVKQKRGDQSLCLDIENGSLGDKANVQQYQCTGNDNQMWYIYEGYTFGYSKIRNKKSGKCLDVEGASLADRANVQQFTCN